MALRMSVRFFSRCPARRRAAGGQAFPNTPAYRSPIYVTNSILPRFSSVTLRTLPHFPRGQAGPSSWQQVRPLPPIQALAFWARRLREGRSEPERSEGEAEGYVCNKNEIAPLCAGKHKRGMMKLAGRLRIRVEQTCLRLIAQEHLRHPELAGVRVVVDADPDLRIERLQDICPVAWRAHKGVVGLGGRKIQTVRLGAVKDVLAHHGIIGPIAERREVAVHRRDRPRRWRQVIEV